MVKGRTGSERSGGQAGRGCFARCGGSSAVQGRSGLHLSTAPAIKDCSARSVVSVRPGKLKRVKGKIGKSKFLQTIDEAKVKHNSLAIIFEFPALF